MGRQLLTISLLAGQVFADLHHLFTSSFSTPHLYALEFDDSKDTLTDIANISAHAGHPRISFNYYKSTLYAGEENGFASYRVVNSTGLEYVKSVETKEQCGGVQDASGVTGSPSMVADFANPFNVFGASATGCGEVMPVDSENGLTGVSKPFWYANGSLIQGMAMDEERRTLYSADYQRNGIWVHTIDKTGEPTGGIFVKSPYLNSGPRSVYAHSDGLYVYVLLSRTNAVVVFAVTEGDPASPLTYTGLSYSLLPEGVDPTLYSGEEVVLSEQQNILFATTRYTEHPAVPGEGSNYPEHGSTAARSSWSAGGQQNLYAGKAGQLPKVSRALKKTPQAGYITAILLTTYSEARRPLQSRLVRSGFPIRILFQQETTTTGGLANSVSPAPWGEEYFALADSQYGMIEIWKLENLNKIGYSGDLAQGATTAPVGGWVGKSWSPEGKLTNIGPGNPATAPVTHLEPGTPVQPPQPGEPYGQAGAPWTPPAWRPDTPSPGGSSGAQDPWASNDPGSGFNNPWAPRTGDSPPQGGGEEPRNMDDRPQDPQGDSGALEDDDDEDMRKRLPSLKQSPKFAPYALDGKLDATATSSLSTASAAISSVPEASHPPASPPGLASSRSLVVPLPSSLASSPALASHSPPAILPSVVTTAQVAAASSAADQQPSFAAAPREPPPVAPSPPHPVPPSRPKQAPRPPPASPSPQPNAIAPQASSAAPTPPPPVVETEQKVVARVVATWKAPVDGGIAGRLYKYDELAFDSPSRRFGHGKFQARNRRRDLRDQVPSKSSREAYIKASREGKSCCANVVWYD